MAGHYIQSSSNQFATGAKIKATESKLDDSSAYRDSLFEKHTPE